MVIRGILPGKYSGDSKQDEQTGMEDILRASHSAKEKGAPLSREREWQREIMKCSLELQFGIKPEGECWTWSLLVTTHWEEKDMRELKQALWSGGPQKDQNRALRGSIKPENDRFSTRKRQTQETHNGGRAELKYLQSTSMTYLVWASPEKHSQGDISRLRGCSNNPPTGAANHTHYTESGWDRTPPCAAKPSHWL